MTSKPAPKLRQYEPIWLRIKEKQGKGTVRVACKKADQKRIRKAVWKEKEIDHAFKMENELDGKAARRLKCTFHETYIEFQLVVTGTSFGKGGL